MKNAKIKLILSILMCFIISIIITNYLLNKILLPFYDDRSNNLISYKDKSFRPVVNRDIYPLEIKKIPFGYVSYGSDFTSILDKEILFEIDSQKQRNWLYGHAFFIMGFERLYRSIEIEEPNISTFNATEIYYSKTWDDFNIKKVDILKKIDDKYVINELLKLLASVKITKDMGYSERLGALQFVSQSYPDICFAYYLVKDSNGVIYLRSARTSDHVKINDLLNKYLY